MLKLTRKERLEILHAARIAAMAGDHALAANLFARCAITSVSN